MHLRKIFLVGLAVADCSDPSKIQIITDTQANGTYTTKNVSLASLTNIDEVSGDVFSLFGDTEVSITLTDYPQDKGASREDFVSEATPVLAHWIADGDVAVATDYDSLVMFTAYAHLDAAASYFDALGVTADALTPLPVYYRPKLLGQSIATLGSSDNAAFLLTVDGFLLLKQSFLQDIPLATNPAVIAHEYSHRIWYYETWAGRMFERLSTIEDSEENLAIFNLTRAIDEGVADFFGAVVSQNPTFMAASLPSEYADGRDLTQARTVRSAWVTGEEPVVAGQYDPYQLGAVLASTLWATAEAVGHETAARAVLEAERQLEAQFAVSFDYAVGDFETAFLANLDATPAQHADACEIFTRAYAVVSNRFSGVCP